MTPPVLTASNHLTTLEQADRKDLAKEVRCNSTSFNISNDQVRTDNTSIKMRAVSSSSNLKKVTFNSEVID